MDETKEAYNEYTDQTAETYDEIADDIRDEVYQAMYEIAKETVRRYKKNLYNMKYGEGSSGVIFNALKYQLDTKNRVIYMRADTGSSHMNLVLRGLEYGTGIYGPNKVPIYPIHHKYLRFKKSDKYSFFRHKEDINGHAFEAGGYIYATAVRGVKPGFMLTKAIKSIQNEDYNGMQKYGISIFGEI